MDRLKGFRLPDGADAALITSDVNRRYFTGMKSSAGIVVIFREEAYLIIDFRYIEKAEKTVKNCTVINSLVIYLKSMALRLLPWNPWI